MIAQQAEQPLHSRFRFLNFAWLQGETPVVRQFRIGLIVPLRSSAIQRCPSMGRR